MSADRASPVAANDLALEDHDDMRAEMTVSPLEDTGIPPGVERQILRVGREGQPLLPYRSNGAIGQPDGANLLPRYVSIVQVAKDRFTF